MPVPVGALAAFRPAIGCDRLRAGAEPLAGANANADACPGTDRYCDRDPAPYPYGRAYRCPHPYGGSRYADVDRDGEPDRSAGNRYADPRTRTVGDADADPGTDRYSDRYAEPHGERHADGDGDPGGPAYGNASACLRELARGILHQPRSRRPTGVGADG